MNATPANDLLVHVPPHVPPNLVVDYDYIQSAHNVGSARAATMQLRDKPDVVFTPYYGGHWIATRAEVIAEVFRTPEVFSSFPLTIPPHAVSSEPRPLIEMDPPGSLEYRRNIVALMSPRSVAQFEETARALMTELVNEVLPRGECDFDRDVALKLPTFIIMRWLGLPFEDRFKLLEWTDLLFSHPNSDVRLQQRIKTDQYLAQIVADRQARPADDLISAVVAAKVRGRSLSLEEGIAISANLVYGGMDTVRNMMNCVAYFLAENSEHRRELIQDRTLIPAAIEELTRWQGIANIARTITKNHVFHGVELKKGEQILLPLVLAGTDDRVWDDALTVTFRRAAGRHIGYGVGAHACPGAHLARLELRAFVDVWLSHIPDFWVKPSTRPIPVSGIASGMRALVLQWTPSRAGSERALDAAGQHAR
jgi:cytochrome P450